MKTRTIVSATPRQMRLAFLLLTAAQGLGGCDQRTAIALTLTAPPAVEIDILQVPDRLDLLVLKGDRVVDCNIYPLVPPRDGGTGSFIVKSDGSREARILYYPSLDDPGLLTLTVSVYKAGTFTDFGGAGATEVNLVPRQLNRALIRLTGRRDVDSLCSGLPRPDLAPAPDLLSPIDLAGGSDLGTADMIIEKDLTPVEDPDLSAPGRDLAVTDGRPSIEAGPDPNDLTVTSDGQFPSYDLAGMDGNIPPYDLSIPPDQGTNPYDLAVSDGFMNPFDMVFTSDLNPPPNLCDDSNPCTEDFVVPIGGGSYTCQRRPAQQGTTCRSAAGSCDVPEVCDGVSFQCPPDSLRPIGAPCRAPANFCDTSELCTGNSADCPPQVIYAICNGAFDNGTPEPWTLAPHPQLNRLSNSELPCKSFSSPNYNVLCGQRDCVAQTYQNLYIPAGASGRLVFWLNIVPDQNGLADGDDFFAEIQDGTAFIPLLAESSSRDVVDGYVRYEYSVGPFRNQNVLLRFKAQTTSAYAANFCIDDVSLVLY